MQSHWKHYNQLIAWRAALRPRSIRSVTEGLYDLQDPFDPLSEADLVVFEKEIGVRLPEDYRAFLLLRNGGGLPYQNAFNDHLFAFDDEEVECFVYELFGLTKETDWCDLRTQHRDMSEDLPQGLLPIGETGNSHVFLGVSAERYGKIYFLNRDYEWEDSIEEAIDELCDSFTHFLGRLRPWKEALDFAIDEAQNVSGPPFPSIHLYDLAAVKRYLARGGDIDIRNEQAHTPLICAIEEQRSSIAAFLIESGANIHAVDNRDRTPLHWACRMGCFDIARMLLQRGAEPFLKDDEGVSCLKDVASGGSSRITQLFLGHLESLGIAIDKVAFARAAKLYPVDSWDSHVFFHHPECGAEIENSGLVVLCAQHPDSEQGLEHPTTTLDQLVTLWPASLFMKKEIEPLHEIRLQFCRDIFSSASKQITPIYEAATLQGIVDCVEALIESVERTTKDCGTASDAHEAMTPWEENQLGEQLLERLKPTCEQRPKTEPVEVKKRDLDSETILFREPGEEVTRVLKGTCLGLFNFTHCYNEAGQIDETPTLHWVVHMNQIDSPPPKGDFKPIVLEAIFEFCDSIYQEVAKAITVERQKVTLGELSACVQHFYDRVYQQMLSCKTKQDVEGAFSSSARDELAKSLATCLGQICR